ncbi:MAG: hypothetical protein DDT20_01727 [Firmicutes bacterium]|nr:hypothetical protein [Bacillota bacterium]
MRLLDALRARRKNTQGTENGVRDWLPIADIRPRTIKKKDGSCAAVVRVTPLNMSLKSDNERKRVVAALHEVLNGIKVPLQIFTIGRPIDLDSYLRRLNEKAAEEPNPTRKRLLREYSRHVASVAAGGETAERRFYMLLSGEDDAHTVGAAQELMTSLSGAGLASSLCEGQEIMELLFCFFNPDKAATERIGGPGAILPPIYPF